MINGRTFPRKLSSVENMLLFSVLPESKLGYKIYRDKINSLLVVGPGRFGGGNFILGSESSKPDLSIPSSPVFAIGTNIYKEGTIDIIIHEESDKKIEYDISVRGQSSIPDSLTEVRKWNYSEWNPGDKAPDDNSDVREVPVIINKYILAIAPLHKKLWLHEKENGVNHPIPVTNYYNELMRICDVKDNKIALKPSSFFDNLFNYKDEELRLAFISYNRYLKRIAIKETVSIAQSAKRKKNFFSIFRKGDH